MLLVRRRSCRHQESASEASPSSEKWLSVRRWTTEEITRKALISLLEDMMDTPSITGDDPQEAANKEIQKYIWIDVNPAETLVKW